MPVAPKPREYFARRAWQDDARARGEDPECGHETCKAKAAPAWINKHTPLLYCEGCAWMINKWNEGFCSPEVR